jgi:hypothetical protein
MYIYKITNTMDGMFYIGATTRSPSTRFSEMRSKAIKNPLKNTSRISVALRSFDKSAFEVQELFYVFEKQYLFDVEKEFIAALNATEIGYNQSLGGLGDASFFQTRKSRKKHAAALTGKKRAPFSEETKRKMSEKAKLRALLPGERERRSKNAAKQIMNIRRDEKTGRLVSRDG